MLCIGSIYVIVCSLICMYNAAWMWTFLLLLQHELQLHHYEWNEHWNIWIREYACMLTILIPCLHVLMFAGWFMSFERDLSVSVYTVHTENSALVARIILMSKNKGKKQQRMKDARKRISKTTLIYKKAPSKTKTKCILWNRQNYYQWQRK